MTFESINWFESIFSSLLYLDSGLEDINGIFDDIQSYQPTVPSTEVEILVVFIMYPCSLKNSLLTHFQFYRFCKSHSEMSEMDCQRNLWLTKLWAETSNLP